MLTNQLDAMAQADKLLEDAGLPSYSQLRILLLGLNEQEIFDHENSDGQELKLLKQRALEVSEELDPVADLGQVDHLDEIASRAAPSRQRNA